MATILDLSLRHTFWPDLEAAKRAAYAEAANTGALILKVDAIEVRQSTITFIGTIPDQTSSDDRAPARYACPVRSLQTTWGAILRPSGILAYLVIGRSLSCSRRSGGLSSSSRAAVAVERTFTTIPSGNLGALCCAVCRVPISAARLSALPDAKLCVTCQALTEEK
jgi:hypothetical protein